MTRPDPDTPPPISTRRSRRALVLLGVAIGLFIEVVAAVVWLVGFRTPGYFVTNRVDIHDVQAGVQQILTDTVTGYGATNVRDVTCNKGENPVAEKGASFSCTLTVHGVPRQVTVTFLDDDGTYQVGRPT